MSGNRNGNKSPPRLTGEPRKPLNLEVLHTPTALRFSPEEEENLSSIGGSEGYNVDNGSRTPSTLVASGNNNGNNGNNTYNGNKGNNSNNGNSTISSIEENEENGHNVYNKNNSQNARTTGLNEYPVLGGKNFRKSRKQAGGSRKGKASRKGKGSRKNKKSRKASRKGKNRN